MLAQNDVTKFLGIPVDGYKSKMIEKLKAKGFTYDSQHDYFNGEFNGHEVMLSIVTNNNKVWRIMVADKTNSSETDIRIRFNSLCRQFEKNIKYIKPEVSYMIPEDEDISYEMTIKKKRYEALYYQMNFEGSDIMSSQEIQKLYEDTTRKCVWFMINKSNYGEYYITMFYDNMNNKADGEDL